MITMQRKHSMKASIFGSKKDIHYMEHAICEAEKAQSKGEVPIGAVVVDTHGTIIGKGHNSVEFYCSQRAHAEIIAIENASSSISNWRLGGCWLYVTLEPCVMCMGLITLSRMSGVVFALTSQRFGYRLDKDERVSVYNRRLLVTIEGVCQEQSATLLKEFFQFQRNNCGEKFRSC